MALRSSMALVAVASALGCSVVTTYPEPSDESGLERCTNGRDDDLDGDFDCDEPVCRPYCIVPLAAPASPARIECPAEWTAETLAEPAPSRAPTERIETCVPPAVRSTVVAEEPEPDVRMLVYVREGAEGGDGSEARPFGTIAEGVAAAELESFIDGDAHVWVEPGTYRERIAGNAISVFGAGADRVYVAPPAEGLAGGEPLVSAMVSLHLEGVTVEGPVRAAGATTLSRVRIDGDLGHALELVATDSGEPSLDADHVELRSRGAFATETLVLPALSIALLDDVVVAHEDGDVPAVLAQNARIDMAAVRIEGSIDARGPLARVGGHDVFVRTDDDAAPREIAAITVYDRATLDLVDARIEHPDRDGIFALQETVVRLASVALRGSPGARDVTFASISLVAGATLDAANVALLDAHGAAVAARALDTEPSITATFTDLTVLMAPVDDLDTGRFSVGVAALGNVSLFLERAWIAGHADVGVSLAEAFDSDPATPSAMLRDVTVRDVRLDPCLTSGACDGLGIGILATSTAALDLDRFHLEHIAGCGLSLGAGGDATIGSGAILSTIIALCGPSESDALGLLDDVVLRDNESDVRPEGAAARCVDALSAAAGCPTPFAP